MQLPVRAAVIHGQVEAVSPFIVQIRIATTVEDINVLERVYNKITRELRYFFQEIIQ